MAQTLHDDLPTARQQAVFDAVLDLMVSAGGGVTMTAVASRASCSKETLYKWFGDRDGLMAAAVRWQASRVRAGRYEGQALDAGQLRSSLQDFAQTWLETITSRTSIALNRVAIGQAGASDGNLGRIVLENGRFAIGARLKPLLEESRATGLLVFDDVEEAFRTFFGLVGRDVQIRVLLGDRIKLGKAEIAADAARATEQFFALYGAGRKSPNHNPRNA